MGVQSAACKAISHGQGLWYMAHQSLDYAFVLQHQYFLTSYDISWWVLMW